MSQINIGKLVGILLLSASLSACGDANTNPQVVPMSGSGSHPAGWITTHKSAALSSCTQCHGEDLGGGISNVSCMSKTAVSGFTCHATSPVANPVGCISCHGGKPYGPYGSTAPNRRFAHSKHTLLLNDCNSCHPNAGSGTPNHARATASGGVQSAFVHLTSSYRAKAFTTYGYDQATGKCSGVSCHGGQDSPVWSTGTITIASDCSLCHVRGTSVGNPQYNSYYSGKGATATPYLHDLHLGFTFPSSGGVSVTCSDCHNVGIMTDYEKHFSSIRTNSFTSPAATIGGYPAKVGNYDMLLQKCSNTLTGCHFLNMPRYWNQ